MTSLIEVVRGNPDDIELAAVIAALLAARSRGQGPASGTAPPADRRGSAGWRHGEDGYRSPRSWSSR